MGTQPLPKNGAEPLPNFRKKGKPIPAQFSADVYCGQTAASIKMPPGTEVGLGTDDIVLHGDPAPPSQKGGRAPSPIFGPCLLWPNCWMDQGGTCHGGGPWSRPHCARWGHSSPPQKRVRAPQFLAHVYCGQDTWIKIPLGTEVGLNPVDFVFDGDPAPPSQKGGRAPSPIFGPCLLWPSGWMDQDANRYGGKPRPRRRCVR